MATIYKRPGFWVVLMAGLVIMPLLGSTGLWDPWETHYAEVARRMLTDGDWITLRWRQEMFYSKPVGIFWLMAISFKLFGINAWAARLPFALIGILGVWLSYRFVSKITDTRRGLWAAGVLATTPFYYIISRQAITDIPFAVFMLGALGSFIIVILSERTSQWEVAAIYIFAALAALAKTPVGLAIPAAVALVYFLLTGDWRSIKKLKLQWGIPLFFIIAAPWYVVMSLKHGAAFYDEFFLHHNLQRAFTGVHGERGTFEYFIKQMGYGLFPWVAMLPLAFSRLFSTFRTKKNEVALRLMTPSVDSVSVKFDIFLMVWAAVTFVTFTLIVTKFHHYVFPAVAPLAILIGLGMADRDAGTWRIVVPISVLLLAMIGNDVISNSTHISNLCTYAYDRPLPEDQYPRWTLLILSILFGTVMLAAHWLKSRAIPATLALLAAITALWISWGWIAHLGDTMGQQALFETYHKVAKPGEKLYQYQMNWRGEVFYSADTIIKLSNPAAVKRVFSKPGRHFIIAVTDGFAAVDRAIRQSEGKHLHVLPGSGLRYVLASNEIDPGMEDLNPLSRDVLSKPPAIAHPLSAGWTDGIDFLGYNLDPEHPARGHDFTLTLFFKCKKTISKNWKVFIHIDGHGHEFHRVNGDHFPLSGLFPTNDWMPGDIIRDKVVLHLPIEFTAKTYAIYLGFYIGSKRMTVLPGSPSDGDNRLRAGTFTME